MAVLCICIYLVWASVYNYSVVLYRIVYEFLSSTYIYGRILDKSRLADDIYSINNNTPQIKATYIDNKKTNTTMHMQLVRYGMVGKPYKGTPSA